MRVFRYHQSGKRQGRKDCRLPGYRLRDGEEDARRHRNRGPLAALTGFQNNPVYRSAAKNLKHVACPVPSGILKALEVEAGLNVLKDASITFVKEK